jgi:hypothetical protein
MENAKNLVLRGIPDCSGSDFVFVPHPGSRRVVAHRPIREEAVRYWDARKEMQLKVPVVFLNARKCCVHSCRGASINWR